MGSIGEYKGRYGELVVDFDLRIVKDNLDRREIVHDSIKEFASRDMVYKEILDDLVSDYKEVVDGHDGRFEGHSYLGNHEGYTCYFSTGLCFSITDKGCVFSYASFNNVREVV